MNPSSLSTAATRCLKEPQIEMDESDYFTITEVVTDSRCDPVRHTHTHTHTHTRQTRGFLLRLF